MLILYGAYEIIAIVSDAIVLPSGSSNFALW